LTNAYFAQVTPFSRIIKDWCVLDILMLLVHFLVKDDWLLAGCGHGGKTG
jgi:hypothetical protein